MKWKHSRKGLIEGKIIKDDGEWVDIKLKNYVSGINREWYKGETITVRKAFLTRIK